ncbi:TatD family hydrolase [Candidatus Saccharibacteria bacterium]|nr:TatD family hydrolase [Candidatus Saccharibacteria bacterium]
MLIDSHCHIHDTETYEFALSRAQKPTSLAYTPDALLARAEAAGIKKLICIGTSHEDSLKAQAFATSRDNVFWTYGIHPDEAGTREAKGSQNNKEISPRKIINARGPESRTGAKRNLGEGPTERCDFEGREISRSENPLPSEFPPRLVAIGEIGLDYRNGTGTKEQQIRLLEQMLELATDSDLPCVFHVREAFDDFFAVLRNFPGIKRAVVHSFSDSPENLKKVLGLDFYVGVNGLSTFANIPLPPLSRTLLETDSPFLAPVPHRGEVDEPAFVRNIANFLAIHYQTTFDDVANITTENAERLFKI